MRPIQSLVALALLIPVAIQAGDVEGVLSIERPEARVIGQAGAGGSLKVAFGPVQLTLPAGWSLGKDRNPWSAAGPDGSAIWVSVLSDAERRPLTSQRLQAAQIRLSALVSEMCTFGQGAPIEAVLQEPQKVIYRGGCQEHTGQNLRFGAHYEIHSVAGIVQLLGVARGDYVRGNREFDSIARSLEW
jgi:hypothetical protein